MSFSSDVKEELSRMSSKPCCQKAELMAFVRMAGTLKISGGSRRQTYLQIQTAHAPTMRRFYKLLKKHMILPEQIAVKKNNFLKENNLYIITVALSHPETLIKNLGIFSEHDAYPEKENVKTRCCKRAYIRGAFLGSGSISDPLGPYHMEFVTSDRRHAVNLSNLINEFELNSKVMERKNNYMVYLKDGDNISDLLGIMGAHNSVLKFEDIRVLKEMRNSVNRVVNCETANLNKTIGAAFRQIESIKYIKKRQYFDLLPQNLKEIAQLRLDYPDLSLKELGKFLTPTLGKSGVSYRLKKIEEIARKLQSEEGEGKGNV